MSERVLKRAVLRKGEKPPEDLDPNNVLYADETTASRLIEPDTDSLVDEIVVLYIGKEEE